MKTSRVLQRLTGVLLASAVIFGFASMGPVQAAPSLSPSMQSITGKVGTAITPTAALSSPILDSTRTFTISPALPTGLVLSATTGVVSGTPVAELPLTNFRITGSDGTKSASATLVMSVTVTGLPPAPLLNSARPGCKPVTFAANVTTTMQAVDAELPSLDFACSVHLGIKNAGFALAISTLGTKANPTVARYQVVASRVGGPSMTKFVGVQPPAQVLRRQFRPLSSGTWLVAITALAPNGTSMGTWTSDVFVIR